MRVLETVLCLDPESCTAAETLSRSNSEYSLSVIDACKSGHIRCHCGFDTDWPYRHIHLSSEWAMDE